MEGSEDRGWVGSPWDVGYLDPYGIREVMIEFDNGDSDVFRARLRDEFYSYELQQMAVYVATLASYIR